MRRLSRAESEYAPSEELKSSHVPLVASRANPVYIFIFALFKICGEAMTSLVAGGLSRVMKKSALSSSVQCTPEGEFLSFAFGERFSEISMNSSIILHSTHGFTFCGSRGRKSHCLA